MKKSTLLSLATAGAIVATSAGTYAAWDVLSDDTTANVTFRNPVTVTVDPTYTLSQSTATLSQVPTASGTVTFTVKDKGELVDTLTIKPTITGGNSATGKPATLDDFDIKILENNVELNGDVTKGFVDEDLSATTYTVTVTPKDTNKVKENLYNSQVNIQLTATLSKR